MGRLATFSMPLHTALQPQRSTALATPERTGPSMSNLQKLSKYRSRQARGFEQISCPAAEQRTRSNTICVTSFGV